MAMEKTITMTYTQYQELRELAKLKVAELEDAMKEYVDALEQENKKLIAYNDKLHTRLAILEPDSAVSRTHMLEHNCCVARLCNKPYDYIRMGKNKLREILQIRDRNKDTLKEEVE